MSTATDTKLRQTVIPRTVVFCDIKMLRNSRQFFTVSPFWNVENDTLAAIELQQRHDSSKMTSSRTAAVCECRYQGLLWRRYRQRASQSLDKPRRVEL